MVRKLTYPVVRKCHSYEELFAQVSNFCDQVNTICLPSLPCRELKSISNSVTGWCWKNRDKLGGKYNRGACELEPMPKDLDPDQRRVELRRRRQTGAHYMNLTQKASTRQKIKSAVDVLRFQNKPITKAAIARMTGLHRNTVNNYASLLGF